MTTLGMISALLQWLSEHGAVLCVAISAVITVLLTTKWGRARGGALHSIARVVEALSVTGDSVSPGALKMRIAEEMGAGRLSEQRALEAVVDAVDRKKRPESKAKKFGKFVGRALLGIVLRRVS